WKGGLLVPVSPQNTSRKCPRCRHTAAENRQTQTKFVCVKCGFSAHADWVAAINIKEAGLASLACSSSSHARNASCQEPTEGIVCASVQSRQEFPPFTEGRMSNQDSKLFFLVQLQPNGLSKLPLLLVEAVQVIGTQFERCRHMQC